MIFSFRTFLESLPIINQDGKEYTCDFCGRCCTGVSIHSTLPDGSIFHKEAGQRCIHLGLDNLCKIYGDTDKQPAVCRNIKAANDLCRFDLRGDPAEAKKHYKYLASLERATKPKMCDYIIISIALSLLTSSETPVDRYNTYEMCEALKEASCYLDIVDKSSVNVYFNYDAYQQRSSIDIFIYDLNTLRTNWQKMKHAPALIHVNRFYVPNGVLTNLTEINLSYRSHLEKIKFSHKNHELIDEVIAETNFLLSIYNKIRLVNEYKKEYSFLCRKILLELRDLLGDAIFYGSKPLPSPIPIWRFMEIE